MEIGHIEDLYGRWILKYVLRKEMGEDALDFKWLAFTRSGRSVWGRRHKRRQQNKFSSSFSLLMFQSSKIQPKTPALLSLDSGFMQWENGKFC
jgi:hypothetical protein